MSGWLKLHRQITEHPRFFDGDWLKVWLWMLCEAKYELGSKVIWQGRETDLQPGQFTAGRLQIAKETRVHEQKVKRIISCLKSDQQIDHQRGNKYSLFTVLNWDQYQGCDQQIDQQMTNKRPTDDQQVTTTEEGKKERREEVDRAQSSKARPASVEEVRLYAAKAGLPDAAEAFWDHFESNGWKVSGRASMKNWQAAYRNWCRREKNHASNNEYTGLFADAF